MKTTCLNSSTINVGFSCECINNTREKVKTTYEFDKSQPYANYRCAAVIEVAHLKKHGMQSPLLRIDNSNNLVKSACLHEIKNLNAIPVSLFTHAKKSKRAFIHVLVERRIFYYEKEHEKDDFRILLRPEQKRLGFFSNKLVVTQKALDFLENKDLFLTILKKRMIRKFHQLSCKIHSIVQIIHHAAA